MPLKAERAGEEEKARRCLREAGEWAFRGRGLREKLTMWAWNLFQSTALSSFSPVLLLPSS